MTEKTISNHLAGITLALLMTGTLLFTPGRVVAEVTDLPGVGYDVSASLGENLKSLAGKKIHLSLVGGANLTGTVKAVGNDLLHLEKLEGKEYFDALVRIGEITQIDTRFRDQQR